MKLNSPLPQPLSKECIKAANIFKSFVDNGNNGLDGVVPRSILENAKGFAIFTIFKAGFIFSARAGSGIVIAKLENGSWSAPSAIGTAGLGLGGQAGAEMTDFLIVLNSRSAIRSFMAAGSLTLGGNMSLALGPLGRNGEASGALNTNGKMAAMYSYSKTRGLFGGVSVEGSVIVERQDANFQAYDSPVTARMLLGGAVDPPDWASPVIKTLEACTGMPGGREWINDLNPGASGATYAFGRGTASSGSRVDTPSFLQKKKKADAPVFPPPSWLSDTQSDSYSGTTAGQSHSRNHTWDGGDYPFHSTSKTSHTSSLASQQKSSGRSLVQSTSPNLENLANPSISSTNPFSRKSSMYTNQGLSTSTSSSFPEKDGPFRSVVPFFKPREELARPLLPHEGIGRAVAIYDFNAVESGDLSFSKGDVIIITQKSDSSNDWCGQGRTVVVKASFPLTL
jgi:lipid-binding SYLF domain-containing protein